MILLNDLIVIATLPARYDLPSCQVPHLRNPRSNEMESEARGCADRIARGHGAGLEAVEDGEGTSVQERQVTQLGILVAWNDIQQFRNSRQDPRIDKSAFEPIEYIWSWL